MAALCPPDGPLLPRPTTLSTSDALKNATSFLKFTFDAAVAGDLAVSWIVLNISFSIALVSLDNPHPSAPLWEYHHLATGNMNGTRHVDGDSQYLIGSISKVFTDLLLLKTGLNLEDPVTKYLPELKSHDSPIRWEDITLGALGDHLSGMPPTFGYPEIYYLISLFESHGFPHLPDSAFPNCGIIGLNPGCTKQQLLENLKSSHPLAAPNLRPVYSSLAFTILSYAMEVATGKNYSQLLDEEILIPLNMTNTGVSPGVDGKAVVPPGDNSWGADYGDNAPGGGLYSSAHDISSLVIDLISPDPKPLTRAQIHAWLKPLSTTTQLTTLIFRTQNLTPEHPHTIDIYTKGGAAYGYEATMGVIDQYGIGYVVLTAGARGTEAQMPLVQALLGTVMPIVEAETRKAAEVYVGSYTAGLGEMVAGTDDGPGLRLKNLSLNGTDMLDTIKTLYDSQPVSLGKLSDEMRLYPTDVWEEVEVEGKKMIEEDWRLQYDTLDEGYESELPSWDEKPSQCVAWWTGDALYYGGESLDRFVFVRDGYGGKVVEARVPSLRMNLTMHG